MKRFFAIVAALLLTVLLAAACGPKNQGVVYCPATEEGIVFSATVEERKENSLLVLADEGASVRSSSDRFLVALSGAQLLDQEGNALEAADFWLLDRVEIAFEGQVAETYPAQITAKKGHPPAQGAFDPGAGAGAGGEGGGAHLGRLCPL